MDPCLPSGIHPAPEWSQRLPGFQVGPSQSRGHCGADSSPRIPSIPIPASSPAQGHLGSGALHSSFRSCPSVCPWIWEPPWEQSLQQTTSPQLPNFTPTAPRDPRSCFGINPELILSEIPFSRLNLGVVYAGICGDSSPSPQALLGSIWARAGTGGPHGAFPVGAVSSSASNFSFFHEFIPSFTPLPRLQLQPQTHLCTSGLAFAATRESSWELFTSWIGAVFPPFPGLGPSEPDTEPGKLRVRL